MSDLNFTLKKAGKSQGIYRKASIIIMDELYVLFEVRFQGQLLIALITIVSQKLEVCDQSGSNALDLKPQQ